MQMIKIHAAPSPYGLMELEAFLGKLRLEQSPPEDKHLEELRQQYESVLCLLESEFLAAIVGGDWTEFDEFVQSFREDDD